MARALLSARHLIVSHCQWSQQEWYEISDALQESVCPVLWFDLCYEADAVQEKV